jgi:hypothetical protein
MPIKRYWIFSGLGAGLLVAVAATAYQWSLGWMPKWSIGHSYVLRSATVWRQGKPKKSDRILKWKLRIPEPFFVRTDAYYATAYDHGLRRKKTAWRRFSSGYSDLWIIGSLLPDGNLSADWRSRTRNQFDIQIANGDGLFDQFSMDYCVTDNERLAAVRRRKKRENGIIYMSFKGWPASVAVSSKELYSHPGQACEILRNILASWTVSIDDRRLN